MARNRSRNNEQQGDPPLKRWLDSVGAWFNNAAAASEQPGWFNNANPGGMTWNQNGAPVYTGGVPVTGTWANPTLPTYAPATVPAPVSAPVTSYIPPPTAPVMVGGYVPPPTSPNVVTGPGGPLTLPGTTLPVYTTPYVDPANAGRQGQQQAAGGNYVGPGENWKWTPTEYWNTAAAFGAEQMGYQDKTDARDLRPGWYGSGGDYLGNDGGQGVGNRENPTAIRIGDKNWGNYDMYGNPTGGAIGFGHVGYQGGRKGLSGWLPQIEAQGWTKADRTWRKQNTYDKKTGGGHNNGGRTGSTSGGGTTTPNWMGQMTSFNP